MLFEEKHYGSPISEKLSEIIRRYTDKDDIADTSRRTDISVSTIRDVIYRRNSLTENNSGAIVAMAGIAFRNCLDSRQQADEDTEYFAKELKVLK